MNFSSTSPDKCEHRYLRSHTVLSNPAVVKSSCMECRTRVTLHIPVERIYNARKTGLTAIQYVEERVRVNMNDFIEARFKKQPRKIIVW